MIVPPSSPASVAMITKPVRNFPNFFFFFTERLLCCIEDDV